MTFSVMGKSFLLLFNLGAVAAALAQEPGESRRDSALVADSARYETAPIVVTATRSERTREQVPYEIGRAHV